MKAPNALTATLQFLKIHNPHLAQNPDVSAEETADSTQQTRDKPMRAVSNLGGYSAVFMPGGSPSFIIKSSKTIPKVIGLQGVGVRGLSSFHTEGCDRGFIYADVEGIARVAQLPDDTTFAELGISLQKIELGQDVHVISYHAPMECYVVGTSTQVTFELPKDDDHRRDWQKEDIPFKPSTEQGFLKVINPINWSVIDAIELDPCEVVLCVRTLDLVVSEITNERKQLITVGTAVTQGEDLPTKGRIYVYDIVTVVPELDRPETNKKLKLIAKEEIPRGAITAISEIGTQGFMLVAQGQKCMVRGLKEDGTLLPVAFMDMNSYVTSIKELRGTGLCVMADVLKGVWFSGYTEEPYKMLLFGKSAGKMEVVHADLLPDGKDLYIVVADGDCNLHVMQYDPEREFLRLCPLLLLLKKWLIDPKSLHGHLLLHRTSFSLGGHLPTTMTLLPSISPSPILPISSQQMLEPSPNPLNSLLLTSSTGVLSLLTPVTESQYRRLGALASHLTNTLYHACGLNPREYRIDRDAPEGMVGGRTVIDGGMLGRWMELGSQRRAEVIGRAGVDGEELREDLLGLREGLGYF